MKQTLRAHFGVADTVDVAAKPADAVAARDLDVDLPEEWDDPSANQWPNSQERAAPTASLTDRSPLY